MEVVEPCLICLNISVCECKSSLLSFFRLLESANKRVLSLNSTSSLGQPSVINAGIDKLSGHLRHLVPVAEIKKAAKKIGYQYDQVYLKNRKPYLVIGNENKVIHLALSFDQHEVNGFVTNPNRFESWPNYWSIMSDVLPEEALEASVIGRIDLNIDFSVSFHELIQHLDFTGKQNAIVFAESSGIRTGITVGKGSESVVIYDKARKEKVDTDWSRIEVRLTGKKLPTKSIVKIPSCIQSSKAFSFISGKTVDFPSNELLTETQIDRLRSFKEILKRDGYYSAKKSMDRSRNFERDYSQLIRVLPWPCQPQQLFESEIKKFIQ